MARNIDPEPETVPSQKGDERRFYSIVEDTLTNWSWNEYCPLRTLIHNMYLLGHFFCSRTGSSEGLYRIDIDESFAHALADYMSGRLTLEILDEDLLVRPMELARWVVLEETDFPINRVFAWAARDFHTEVGMAFREMLTTLDAQRAREHSRRPDPALNTRAVCWTERDEFHFRTETEGMIDGERILAPTERAGKLLSLLCARWPDPVPVGDVMDVLYAGQRDAKARGRVRAVFSETRDQLESAGINPDVVPKLDTCVEETAAVSLRVHALGNLDLSRHTV